MRSALLSRDRGVTGDPEAPGARRPRTGVVDADARAGAHPGVLDGWAVARDPQRLAGDQVLADHALSEEVFGPLGLVVRVSSVDEMETLARNFEGQLTATIHMDAGDLDDAKRLRPFLERKAGRVLVNGFPTGVEVVDAQVHGGPYPASTNFGATSVGTLSIRRWLRPVAYQNMPAALLPEDWA